MSPPACGLQLSWMIPCSYLGDLQHAEVLRHLGWRRFVVYQEISGDLLAERFEHGTQLESET